MQKLLLPPEKLAKELAKLKFSRKLNNRLTTLMSRNTEGTITKHEREELKAIIDLNHTMTLFKAQAMFFLGIRPTEK